MKLVIAVIATFDTKEREALFLKQCIEESGHEALMIDTGLSRDPDSEPGVSRRDLLVLGGLSADDQRKHSSNKEVLLKAMRAGLKKKLVQLYETKNIQGVLSIGGAQGTALSTSAMQLLPIGFPKVMISTVAAGTAMFGDYVGNRDITMIPSLCDVCGINEITAPIFTMGCGAVLGMAESIVRSGPLVSDKPLVALTMAGVTTKCVMKVKDLLERDGFETVVCHCNGVGAIIIDELAEADKLTAVIDVTRHDVGGFLFDGLMQSDADRFGNVYAKGVPIIEVPGGMDFVLVGPPPVTRQDLKGQPYSIHTPYHTHVRADYEKMFQAGEHDARELSELSRGPAAIVVPTRGYSQNNIDGGMLYDPKANLGYIDGVKSVISDAFTFVELDMHINEHAFAVALVQMLHSLLKTQDA